jgi:uncharacterized protein DUF6457
MATASTVSLGRGTTSEAMMIDAWVNDLAEALGVEAPGTGEISQLLDVARDVAHGVERRLTPVATYVLGASVQHRIAGGAAREEALAEAVATLQRWIERTGPQEETR